MESLALTFAVLSVIMTVFVIWLKSKAGKKWLQNL